MTERFTTKDGPILVDVTTIDKIEHTTGDYATIFLKDGTSVEILTKGEFMSPRLGHHFAQKFHQVFSPEKTLIINVDAITSYAKKGTVVTLQLRSCEAVFDDLLERELDEIRKLRALS